MYKQILDLEQRTQGTTLGKILFSDEDYNLKDLYWNAYYTITFAALAGGGNSMKAPNAERMLSDFQEGFFNNAKMGAVLNSFYAYFVDVMSRTTNSSLYNNIFCASVQAAFLAGHYLSGTSNPVETMTIPIAASFFLTNYHTRTIQQEAAIERIRQI